MQSIYQNLGGTIVMPQFSERKLYMHKSHMSNIILPKEFVDYQDPIENILKKVNDRNNVCYITIDEKKIKNETHRRGGIHCDFNWYENLNAHNEGAASGDWGNGGGGGSTWGPPIIPGHQRAMNAAGQHGWKRHELDTGGMLLVSNYEGCRVWKGDIKGEIGEGGCCKNVDVSQMQTEIMPAGEVYYLNALGIHESILLKKEVDRSLIRINFHPEYTFN